EEYEQQRRRGQHEQRTQRVVAVLQPLQQRARRTRDSRAIEPIARLRQHWHVWTATFWSASDLVVPLGAFLRALGGLLRRLGPARRFGDHVGDDEIGNRAS